MLPWFLWTSLAGIAVVGVGLLLLGQKSDKWSWLLVGLGVAIMLVSAYFAH